MTKNSKSPAIAVIFLQISVFGALGHEKGFVKNNLQRTGTGECNEVITGITISALVTQTPIRPYEVWWKCSNPNSGDWLGLFPKVPEASKLATAIDSIKIMETNGWWVSNSPAFVSSPDPYSFKPKCQDIWAAIISADNKTVSGVSCLKTEPTWMWDMKDLLSPMPLTEVFIPGTHDSGAARRYLSPIPDADTYEYMHSVAQGELIINQLIAGARHLDFRVGRYIAYDELWHLHHGTCLFMTLTQAFNHINNFIRTTNEIVVVDVHDVMTCRGLWLEPWYFTTSGVVSFSRKLGKQRKLYREMAGGFYFGTTQVSPAHPDVRKASAWVAVLTGWSARSVKTGGMTAEYHDDLINFFSKHLENHLAPATLGWNTTMGDVWASGKRVILSYYDKNTVNRHRKTLWPPISQKWGNVRTLEDLHKYLNGVHATAPKGPWAAMAELTATLTDVLFERQRSIRVMADKVNKNVSDWYYGEFGANANIVAVDFIRSTNIVDAAIMWNRKRAKKYSKDASD